MVTIPTLQQLCNDVLSEIEAQYNDTVSTNARAALRATSNTLGGKLKLLYLTLANAQKNMLPDLADSVSVGGTLERWGFIKLGRYPFQATNAQYELMVTGSIGSTINGQVTFLSDDDSLNPGQLYILDNAYTLVSSPDYITVRALTPGNAGALMIGDTLSATSPIALVDTSASVFSQVIQPLDAESTDTYKQEVINAFRQEPQGGAATDYRLWAQDAQGVAAIYPYSAGKNMVNIFIESIVSDSIDGKGTPSPSMIAAVQSVIEFNPDESLPTLQRGRRPIQVVPNYLPVTIKNVDIQIPSFVGINAGLQTIILNALTAYVNSVRPFIAAADVISNKNNIIDINNVAAVVLAAAPGSSFGAPVIKINGVQLLTYEFLQGDIPFLNSVTYP